MFGLKVLSVAPFYNYRWFQLYLDNRHNLRELSTIFSTITAWATGLAITALGRQSLSMASRSVVSGIMRLAKINLHSFYQVESYDTSNDFFKVPVTCNRRLRIRTTYVHLLNSAF